MVAAAATCETVAPVCMVPVVVGRRLDLSYELSQVAGVVNAVDLLVAS